MLVRLFRGINAADPEAARAEIARGNLNHPERPWSLFDLRSEAPRILENPGRFAEVEPDLVMHPVTWACGDIGGAAFYASRGSHNPLVVEVMVDVDSVVVDCRDLLCTALQRGTDASQAVLETRAQILERVYGAAVLPYFWAAVAKRDQRDKIALCNAASHDTEVVAAHLRSETVVCGRDGVTFRSAFAVRLPIASANIVAIHDEGIRDLIETPTVGLRDVCGMGPPLV